MYSSESFGRLFWVDDKLEFMTCPQFTDGTGDFDREEYVSDWTDLEGVNLGLLLNIYKVELYNKINHGGSILHKEFAHEITNQRLKDIKGTLL